VTVDGLQGSLKVSDVLELPQLRLQKKVRSPCASTLMR